MADDISLVIKVDDKGVVNAVKNTKSLENNVKKISKAFKGGSLSQRQYYKGIKELAAATGKSEKELRDFANELRRVEKAQKDAADAAKLEAQARRAAAQAAREAAKAARDAANAAREEARVAKEAANAARTRADANRRLRMEFREGYAAQVRLRAAQMRLSQAHRQGIITAEEYRRQLARLGDSAQNSSRHMSRAGVAMQQTGYQVGDFIVQIQSGQNPMIAFGQQATQLVGALYMLPAATLASSVSILGLSVSVGILIASLGIIIPLATAIGAAFMRASGSTRKLKEIVTELETSSNNLITSLNNIKDDTLDQTFGDLADEVSRLESAMVSLEAISARLSLADTLKALEKEAKAGIFTQMGQGGLNILRFVDPTDAFGSGTGLFGMMTSEDVDEAKFAKLGLDMSAAVFRGYTENLQALAAKGDTEGVIIAFSEMAKDATDGVEGINLSGIALLRTLRSAAISAAKMTAELNGSAGAARDLAEDNKNLGEQLLSHVKLYKKALNERKESQKSFREQLYAQSQALTLLTIESELGKKSSAYRSELVAQEAERLQKLLDQKSITEASAKEALALFKTTLDVNDAIANGADSAKSLADELKEADAAMSSLLNVGSLEAKLAGLVAETAAIKSGADAASASLVATELTKAEAVRDKALTGDKDPLEVTKAYQDRVDLINKVGDATIGRNEAREAAKEASKKAGGKSSQKQLAEFLTKKKEEADLQSQLVGLFGTEREIQSELLKAREDYFGVLTPLQDEELENTLRQTAATKEQQAVLEEAKAQQEDLAQSIAGSMGDAFMSIIDGTASVKDAFKSMASAIIKELLQVLVIKRLVGSVGGDGVAGTGLAGWLSKTLPSANGNVFSGGSHVQAYANGGVVGGPTYFPMSGGKTGLMGEAGPEAIMPLKRGANGKLGVQMEGGGGDNVVINQSFNFQANGDDSVKKLIAQAAPKIAQMTKSSMLDDRRRGGQTKSVFG